MYNRKFNLKFGDIERPRNEAKLVMPVTVTTEVPEYGQIELIYLIAGENLEEISAELSSIHTKVSSYLENYVHSNFNLELENQRVADDILVELGLHIDEAFRKSGSEDAKYLATCDDSDQQHLDTLCIELGIAPIRIPDGMSKLVFWIMKNALKKVAVKAKES